MYYRGLILAILSLLLLSIPAACNRESAATDSENVAEAKGSVAGASVNTPAGEGTTDVLIFTDSNFKKYVLNSDRVVVVDFYADWCKPCKALAPRIEELAKENEGKILFGKLNTDLNGQTSRKYAVQALPTLMIFKNGEPAETIVGLYAKNYIQAKIDKVAK